MKSLIVLNIFLLMAQIGFAQNNPPIKQHGQKGKLYMYWGWNRGDYTKSDIRFEGDNYDFELQNVVAKDRQSPFEFDPYFHPRRITIPQYNFRIGYFLTDNWDVSFGVDHMKYVVQVDQEVPISGYIKDSNTNYDREYKTGESITLKDDFLTFEHTDGLNYLNIELRRFDKVLEFNKIKINLTEGFGIGALMPRTNTRILKNERHDEFHFAGYGLGALVGVNVTFWDVFFIQSELKGGYINMPDVRTTKSEADKASHSFFFSQYNILFGVNININKKN